MAQGESEASRALPSVAAGGEKNRRPRSARFSFSPRSSWELICRLYLFYLNRLLSHDVIREQNKSFSVAIEYLVFYLAGSRTCGKRFSKSSLAENSK